MPKWLGDGKERRNGVEDGGIWERRGGDLVVFIRVFSTRTAHALLARAVHRMCTVCTYK